MMSRFGSILQIWIILTGFQDTNDFVNLSIFVNMSSNSHAAAVADLP